MRLSIRAIVAALVLLGSVLLAPAASATPSRGVTAKLLAQHTVGDTDYVLREITIAPGGTTGWHRHLGTLYGVVRGGVLSHFDADCASDGVYKRGQAIVERPDYVHVGRNLGTEPLILEVLYVLPHGAPLAVDEANPGCEFE
ncbi:cupin domain-containing protein [Crossiella cryophila]|uniref:Quercetin dioxygenase-like cupin family protein n=1 Tax=Crossiella cryophila TaxID=43355 RepID=A0A7W7FSV8_9PSEU|nr:cupin domain-containing protein [Crossiella cryophila]MBB4677466.1 quercetin dioxygenase-like cupin family protein [Crossiella cryophila]